MGIIFIDRISITSFFSKVDGVWKTEIVRDSAVITAYVRKRQQIEEELVAEDALAPTGDQDRDARARKKYVLFFLLSDGLSLGTNNFDSD